MRYVFGDYTLDSEHYELRQAGTLVPLEPRVFDLLAYLVQHPGHTVTTEELLEQLYPHQFAPVERLTNCVAQARKALHDTGQARQYIQTVRRRGYCFIAPVAVQQQPETEERRPPAAETPILAVPHGLPQTEASPPASPPAQGTASGPGVAGYDMPDAERRQLTVLVCRLVGVPARREPLDPEVLLDVAGDYHALCTDVVRQFDGQIAQYQGERLVVYFGYPQAHEDDARRAVYTGLGIVAGLAALNSSRQRDSGVQLAVRVGVHTGVVVVDARGHSNTRETLTLGDTPTIAAQVQDLAASNTVLISAATWRLVEGYFVGQPLGAYLLEEAAKPLVVYQVLQERTAQGRVEVAGTTGPTPFVGREQELGLLQERWGQVTEEWG
jgi:class 3 adenylate cyclase